jgi:hypothetical protein
VKSSLGPKTVKLYLEALIVVLLMLNIRRATNIHDNALV